MKTNRGVSVQVVKFADGERFPLILDPASMPLWHPNLYLLLQVRNAGRAPNTTRQVAHAIRLLLNWLQHRNIDEAEFLSVDGSRRNGLVEDLKAFLQGRTFEPAAPRKSAKPKVASLQRVLTRAKLSRAGVSNSTYGARLTYVANYLRWFASQRSEPSDRAPGPVIDALLLTVPKNRDSFVERGWSNEERTRILAAAEGASPQNPFRHAVKARNQLIVDMLYDLGIRAGELLALRVRDFDPRRQTLSIVRRHNSPDDPRIDEPVAKTRERLLPLNDGLAAELEDYILRGRGKLPRAKRHGILFVSHSTSNAGDPLSRSSLSKMLRKLGTAVGPLTMPLRPHEFRHDSNDRFSEEADRQKMSEEREKKIRAYKYGWSPTSNTPAIYTRRHTVRRSKEMSLILQNRGKSK